METGIFAVNRPSMGQGQSVGIFEPTHQYLLHCCRPCIYVGGCVWTSSLKWYKIWLNFGVLKWFCLISNLSQTHCDGTWHSKNTCPAYSCLIINLCFGPSHHLMKSGHGVFPHLYMASNIMFYHDFEDFQYHILVQICTVLLRLRVVLCWYILYLPEHDCIFFLINHLKKSHLIITHILYDSDESMYHHSCT